MNGISLFLRHRHADDCRNVQFVKCDATSWEDQLNMFKLAVANSPARSCDIVVANAGITGPDEIFALEGIPAATALSHT